MKFQSHTPTPLGYRVFTEVRGERLKIGTVWMRGNKGWQFMPEYQAAPSRKFWATPQEALRGRVVGYELEAI